MIQRPIKEPPTPDSLPNTESPRHHSRGSFSRPRLPFRRPSLASEIVFSSRSFQELHTERQYLSSALQGQSARARELIRQYASVEEQFILANEPKQRRRLKKQLSLLRSKLDHSTNQERALLIRLSELSLELQNQENWSQAQQERATHHRAASFDTATSYFALPPASISRLPLRRLSVLDGATSEFIPWHRATDLSRSLGSTYLGTVDEDWDDCSVTHNPVYQYDYGDGCKDNEPRSISWDGEMIPLLARRLSLPSLQSVWPIEDLPQV